MKKNAWAAVTLLCCAVGFYLRWLNAHTELGLPSVDENDVVQQGVAFMGGEWRYYLLEYGALPMYVLAALYRVVAVLHGLTALEYASRIFYDGEEQYLLGRLFCAACYLPLSIASYRFLGPRFGRSAGLVSACLLALPCLDTLTKATVRIDVVQGACQLGALLFLARALESKQVRNWLWAGVFAGLGMACKPLPGALLGPCFWAASWFAAEIDAPVAGPRLGAAALLGGLRSFALRLWRSVSRPALWASGVTALVVAGLANPTALDLRTFIQGQIKATNYYSGPNAPGAHLTAFQPLATLAEPLQIAMPVCVLLMPFVRDTRARLIALFPLLYATAFAGRPVRTYYMVAPAMALCLSIGIVVGLVLCRLGLDARAPERGSSGVPIGSAPVPTWPAFSLGCAVSLALVALLSWYPVNGMDGLRRTTTPPTLARAWIHEHIPSGTRLFHYGTFAGGPRLVSSSWQQESKWADFFDYGRENYEFYQTAFRKAYDDYRSQGRPYYDIDSYLAAPDSVKSGKTRGWLARSLARRAAKEGREYIILGSYRGEHYQDLGYSWIDEVELAQEFGRIAIFRVPQPPPAASEPSAAGNGG
ncbi:MAG: glycosyltransferase family 39 protein [Deltaproteobacteria bacterium]